MSFKDMFANKLIHNDQYVSNTFFIIKKEVLTPKQLEYINQHPRSEMNINSINNALNYYNAHEKEIEKKFEPKYILIPEDIIIPDTLINGDTFINKDYYDFIKSRHCNICILKSETKPYPLGIFTDNDYQFVGLLMPIKGGNIKEAIPYEDYIEKQKENFIKKQQENEKYFMGKCIHSKGIKRKHMEFIKECEGVKFYCLKNSKEAYDQAYIEVNDYMLPTTSITNIENAAKQIQEENIDFHKWIENFFNNRINSTTYECGVSLGYAQYLNREEEAIAYNKIVKEKKQKEREEEYRIKEEQRLQKKRGTGKI